MYLTETHIIKDSKELDDLTFKCKNLYNKANYILRKAVPTAFANGIEGFAVNPKRIKSF